MQRRQLVQLVGRRRQRMQLAGQRGQLRLVQMVGRRRLTQLVQLLGRWRQLRRLRRRIYSIGPCHGARARARARARGRMYAAKANARFLNGGPTR